MVAEGQPSRYDAFVSYSHAADDLLAPRLQAGLQRFAKPWWRRRAIRVFRDESSLSASPHLWGSITEALDGSSWFVLLLSPEAAASEWVNKEIEHWRSVPSRTDRVLPVLTDGEFGWADGDVVGNAVPPALRGVFDSEPRWVDLRFAKGETQLDLKSPDFAAAVADVASAVRGIPKDELESEEVRQHRRTIRTAWAAGILVLLLGVAASVAAVFAFNEQARANAEADRANENAGLATQEAERANENAAEAEAQRAAAEAAAAAEAEARAQADTDAKIAQSQALVLEAEKALDSDPGLSMHLALAAIHGFRETEVETTQAVSVLRKAIAENRVVLREDWGGPVAVSSSGDAIAHKAGLDVVVRSLQSSNILFRCSEDLGLFFFSFFPGESRLVLSDTTGTLATCDRPDGVEILMQGAVVGFDPKGLVFSGDGRYLAWENWDGTVVLSTSDNEIVHTATGYFGPSLGTSGLLSYVNGEVLRVVNVADGAAIRTVPLGGGGFHKTSWSPDGTLVAVSGSGGAVVIEVATGRTLARSHVAATDFVAPVWVGDSNVTLITDSGVTLLDIGTGDESTLAGVGTGFFSLAVVPGTSYVVAGGEFGEGETVMFNASTVGATELGGWISGFDALGHLAYFGDGSRLIMTDGESRYAAVDSLTGGDAAVYASDVPELLGGELERPFVARNGWVAYPDTGSAWAVRDAGSGEVIYDTPEEFFIQGLSPDGTKVVIAGRSACDLLVVDVVTRQTDSQIQTECPPPLERKFFFSPNNTYVLGSRHGFLGTHLFQTDTGALIANLDELDISLASFTTDESVLLAASRSGTVYVLDVAMLVDGFTPIEATLRELSAHGSELQLVRPSPDGSMAITSALGEHLRLWNLATGQLIDEFGGVAGATEHHSGDFHPTEPWLLVASPPNQVRIYTLDLEELIAIAESRLTRELTDAECQQYPGACDS